MKAKATGILMSMPNQYVLFCLNHCIRNQCDTKGNLWAQEQEFMVSDVYYFHFSPGIAGGVFIVMNTHSRVSSQTNANLTTDLRIFIFLVYYIQETAKNKMWDRSQSAPTVCKIINYLLTSSVTHLSLTMVLSFNCFLVLLVLGFYFSGHKWNRWS